MAEKKRNKKPGKSPSQLWYTPEQYELVKTAAKSVQRSMVNFAKFYTLALAKKVIEEHQHMGG